MISTMLFSITAASRSFRVGKFRYRVALPTPAAVAIPSIGAKIPSASKIASAALRIASRLR